MKHIGMVGDIRDGQMGWMGPWHMWRDENGKFWLLGDATLSDRAERTRTLRVCKIGKLYSVEISQCREEIWDRERRLEGGNAVPIPVHEIKFCGIPIWTMTAT